MMKSRAVIWCLNRLWPAPLLYHAISGVTLVPHSGKVLFGADLRSAALQLLWDHRVQGHALAPAAMLLEIAASACSLLTGVTTAV